MPITPLWIHRLAEGIPALTCQSQEWIDRRTLEEVLGVGKWTAWRILRQCGAEDGPGGALVCRREKLVGRLRELQQNPHLAPEIARRERVEQYLAGMLRYASRKHKEIARNQDAEELLGSRFGKLPAGVELDRRELRIEFSGTDDFLRKFGAVVFALQNDFEEISEFLESAGNLDPDQK